MTDEKERECREAFEKWYDNDPRVSEYGAVWHAWQAAWNRRAPAEQWKPISEAPQDGTRIIAWAEEWKAPMTVQKYGLGWSAHYDLGVILPQPTHFMTCPATPKEER